MYNRWKGIFNSVPCSGELQVSITREATGNVLANKVQESETGFWSPLVAAFPLFHGSSNYKCDLIETVSGLLYR